MSKLIGFTPSKTDLYRQAFTHKSALQGKRDAHLSNERLEFLGDAVLSLVIGEYLFHRHPDFTEGQLSQLRARVVNRELFNSLGQALGISTWMEEIAPYKADLESSPSILGNAFEAVVGAIFLDKGYKRVQQFFEHIILANHLDIEQVHALDPNHKSRLLEWAQKNNHKVHFNLQEVTKDGAKLSFRISVTVNGEQHGEATALKKKKAEQEAARQAVEKLGI